MKVNNITDRFRKARPRTQVVWTREETEPILRRKKDSGDGNTWENKTMSKTEAEIDGLCQPAHEGCRDNKR